MIENIILLFDSSPPLAPVTIFSDDFNRANGDIGAPYTISGGTWTITSNRANNASIAASRLLYGGVAPSDCIVKVTFSAFADNTRIIFRYTNATNEWYINGGAGKYTINRRAANAVTVMATIDVVPKSADVVSVRMQGSQIDFYLKDVWQAGVNDSFNQTATLHGFGTSSTATPTFDDFIIQGV